MTHSAALHSVPQGIKHRLTLMETTTDAMPLLFTCSPLTCIVYPSIDTDYTTEEICALLYSQRVKIHWGFSYLPLWELCGSLCLRRAPLSYWSVKQHTYFFRFPGCLFSPPNYSPMAIRLASIKLFVSIIKSTWRSEPRLIKCPENELYKHIRITSTYFLCCEVIWSSFSLSASNGNATPNVAAKGETANLVKLKPFYHLSCLEWCSKWIF